VRLRANDLTGISGLETEELTGLGEYVASNSNAFRVPKDGENIKIEVEYKTSQLEEFLTTFGDRELRCRYSFSNAEIAQEMQVETVVNDEGEETSVYSRVETRKPLSPTYAGVPYVQREETICNDNIIGLIKTSGPVIVDLVQVHGHVKKFIGRQILQVFDACIGGVRLDGSNCLGAQVSSFIRTENPVLIYKVVSRFEWMAPSGSRSSNDFLLEFSPSLVNFSPSGLLNFNGALVRSNQDIDLPYKSISLLELNLDLE